MFKNQAKPSSAISGTPPAKSKPRADCLCVFSVPANHMFANSAPQTFRTHPMTFVEASGVANRMSHVCRALVIPATCDSLDRFNEAPVSRAISASLLKRKAKRVAFVGSVICGYYMN